MKGLTDLLGQLAERLGITVEQIWAFWIPYCAEKAIIQFRVVIFLVAVGFGAVALLALLTYLCWRKEQKEQEGGKSNYAIEPWSTLVILFAICCGITLLTTIGAGSVSGTEAYSNKRLAISQPKGYAMEQLIKKLK